MILRRLSLAAALVALPLTLSAAPSLDPLAGPLEVFVDAGGTTQPGGVIGVDVALQNHATDAAIDVVITRLGIRWSDGSTWSPDLFGGKRLHLGADSTEIAFATLFLPFDAPVGTAVVEIQAHVAHVSHSDGVDERGGIGHRAFAGDGQARDTATFDVIP